MVMQSELSEYAHHLESLLDQVRSGVVGCTSELVSTLLKANDCIIGFIKKYVEKVKLMRISSKRP